MMKKQRLMRIYLGEDDEYNGESLYHAIVMKCREDGLAGVTVTREIEGYGHRSKIHRAKTFALSGDLPITIVAIDDPEKIDQVLPDIAAMMKDGLIYTADVDTVYIHDGKIVE